MNHEILSSYHPASFSNSWLMVWNKSYLNTCHWSPPDIFRRTSHWSGWTWRKGGAKCALFARVWSGPGPWSCGLSAVLRMIVLKTWFDWRLSMVILCPYDSHTYKKRGFAKIGVPQIIQAIRPWLSIETHGDLGYHHFRNPPYTYIHTSIHPCIHTYIQTYIHTYIEIVYPCGFVQRWH